MRRIVSSGRLCCEARRRLGSGRLSCEARAEERYVLLLGPLLARVRSLQLLDRRLQPLPAARVAQVRSGIQVGHARPEEHRRHAVSAGGVRHRIDGVDAGRLGHLGRALHRGTLEEPTISRGTDGAGRGGGAAGRGGGCCARLC